MITRVLAAVVGLGIILPVIVWGGPVGVELMVPVFALLALDEVAAMAFPERRVRALLWLAAGSALVYGAALYAPAQVGGAAIAAVLGSFLWVLAAPGRTLDGAADQVGRYVLGIAWVGGLIAFVPLLRRLDGGVAWIFLALAIPWCGDTGAYFAGRTFGRRKLYELVSPKKTVEGFVGGLLASVGGALAVRALGLPEVPALHAAALGLVGGAAAVAGDLSESMLKRAFGVKDSGRIMPGHGGLLDRIDSLLFVVPLLYGYAVWVEG